MSATNAGPRHADRCLATTVKAARCHCERAEWLDELVPRAQARAEVLDQLAAWAHEQGVFAEVELERPDRDDDARSTRWRGAAVRLGARLARDVYIGVRMTALSLVEECRRPETTRPGAAPTEGAIESDVADEAAIPTVVVAGERL